MQLGAPDLVQAAAEVASGQDTPKRAFAAALARLNLVAKGRYFDGLFLDDALPPGAAFPERLLDADEFTHGVIVTHHKHPSEYRARSVVFVWFMSDQRGDRQAARSRQDY